jgi:hypothetical protein
VESANGVSIGMMKVFYRYIVVIVAHNVTVFNVAVLCTLKLLKLLILQHQYAYFLNKAHKDIYFIS